MYRFPYVVILRRTVSQNVNGRSHAIPLKFPGTRTFSGKYIKRTIPSPSLWEGCLVRDDDEWCLYQEPAGYVQECHKKTSPRHFTCRPMNISWQNPSCTTVDGGGCPPPRGGGGGGGGCGCGGGR